MKPITSLSKEQIQKYSFAIGFFCLFYSVVSKSYRSQNFSTQEIGFWISIAGIIFLSIGLNLKVQQTNEENLGFIKKNTPLIFGLIISIIFIIIWIANNYFNFN